MKKIVIVMITAIFLFSITAACQKEPAKTTDPKEPVKAVDPLEKQKSALHEEIIKNNYTLSDACNTIGTEWVGMWLDKIYPDYGVSDTKIEYKTGAVFSELLESSEIRAYQYSVQFSSQKPIPGAEKSPDGKDILKVLTVMLMENNQVTLSGFLGPEEFQEYDAAEKIYDVVSKDPRYSSKLKAFPKAVLPEEFEQIDMGVIAPDSSHIEMKALPDGLFAGIYATQVDNAGGQKLSVSLFDSKGKKVLKNIELGEYQMLGSWVDEDKLFVRAQKINTSSEEIYNISKDGTMTSEKCLDGISNKLYSPDKSKYAYSDRRSLYVADTKGSSNPKLLIKGKDTDTPNVEHYYPFSWIDDSKLIYGVSGYEWSIGCGMINTENGKNTFFEQAGSNAQPYKVINGKLYTIVGDAGAYFDPGVLDLKDPKYPWRKVFKDSSFIKNTNAEGYVFSPDGTKLVLLKTTMDPYEKNTLYICSTKDGSLLKSYEFQTGYNRPQYLEYMDDGRIAIYSERYVYNPVYMYIVNQ